MIKQLIKASVIFSMFFCMYLALFQGQLIRAYYPNFNAATFASGIILVCGVTMAMVMRNTMVGLAAIIGADIMPWLHSWFIQYLQYASNPFKF